MTYSNPGVLAAKQATTTIPIVIAISGDVVGSGLVDSLNRPGRNLTGQTFFNPEPNLKRLEHQPHNVAGSSSDGAHSLVSRI